MSVQMTKGVAAVPIVDTPSPAAKSRRSVFIRRPFFTAALLVAAAYVLAAIFAPYVAPFDPVKQDFNVMMKAPTVVHWMGTDSYGQDIFSRVIYGARYALIIGIFSVMIGAVGGLIIGLAAGLSGGWAEWGLMRLIDAILAFADPRRRIHRDPGARCRQGRHRSWPFHDRALCANGAQ